MNQFILWHEWTQAFSALRGAFSKQTTFIWALLACAGMNIRDDRQGVSGIVRALGLGESGYHGLLRMFHSRAIDLDKLLELWIKTCLKIFQPICIDGFMVLIGDGIKVAKEGRKMPAVKSLHQESQSNSKAEFIMGHFLQAFSLVIQSPLGSLAAIPLVAEIHDGIVRSNRSKKTLIDKFVELFLKIIRCAEAPAVLIADAFYASKSAIAPLLASGNHLVCRVQHNAVAHYPAERPITLQRGRPQKYGKKIKLRELFRKFDTIATEAEDCRYHCIDLIWKSVKHPVRFVLVEHKTKGRCILLTTHMNLSPLTVIKMYRTRWLIETGFKQGLHVIGTYAYRFWMKSMRPIRRRSRGQFLHRQNSNYRNRVEQKFKTYHLHVMLGCIAQGLAQHLAVNFREQVWQSFSGWLRTIKKNLEPSELVVGKALQSTLPGFLRAGKHSQDWRKFLLNQQDANRQDPLARTG